MSFVPAFSICNIQLSIHTQHKKEISCMAIVTDMYTVVFQLLKMIENVSFISTILRMEAP